MDLEPAKAGRIKERLRWVRRAESKQAAKWRLTRFVNEARSLIADIDLLKPVRTALNTVTRHREAILSRWDSGHSNARIEALNGIFQAAKCRPGDTATMTRSSASSTCWPRLSSIF